MVTNSVILSNDKFGYEMDRVNQNEIAKLVRKWLDGSHAKINIDRNAIKLFVSYCINFVLAYPWLCNWSKSMNDGINKLKASLEVFYIAGQDLFRRLC